VNLALIDLSVIIVTYNPGDRVLDTLHSLPAGSETLSYEVVVVDNASTDGTPERIAHEHLPVQMIVNPDNRGFASANNQGLKRANGRYLLLLNPDVVVQAGALTRMAAFLEANPMAGVVGPRTLDGQGRVALTARAPLSVATVLWQYLGLDRVCPYQVYGHYRRACEQAAQPFEVGWAQGSCLMARREVYEQIGGLDEAFFLFAEEADWCERARSAGWQVWYLPDARVIHYESTSVARYVPVKVRAHHLSPLYYFSKRGRRGSVLALKLGFTVELLAKTVIRLLQQLSGRAEAAVYLHTYRAVLTEVWRYSSKQVVQ
jgi:GT2 family glycosyltransferase